MPKISIIDYGMGNILSVERSFKYCGAEVELINKYAAVVNADFLVLPGVGAFGNAMRELERLELIDAIITFCSKGNPFLGICLGMQMMMDGSYEFGYTKGLSLIPGEVVKIKNTTIDGTLQKIPHIGWNQICKPKHKSLKWNDTILDGINENEYVYFVHSFTAKPVDEFRLADSYYGGQQISAVVKRENLYGCQFHPEKSGVTGLKIIKNFTEL